jgi:TRAP-type C4-dicarboxylate transport system substrate-binding protein
LKIAAVTADIPKLDGFPEKIAEATNGRVKVTVMDVSSLGSSADALNMLRTGTIDMVFNAAGQTPGEFPVSDYCTVPFVAPTVDSNIKAAYALDEKGFMNEFYQDTILLWYGSTDPQIPAFNKKVEKETDLAGMKVRITAGGTIDLMEAMGAVPVQMPLSDVYLSLDKKIVDGFVSSPYMINAMKFYEKVKYVMATPISTGFQYGLINKKLFESMPEDLQKAIQKVGKEQGEIIAELNKKAYDEGLEAIKQTGMVEIYEASPEFLKRMQEISVSIEQRYVEDMNKLGLDGKAILETIKASRQ